MGTTFGVPDERVKAWSAVGVAVLIVLGWTSLEGGSGDSLVLAGLGVVFLGALLALTDFETAGRSLVAAARDRGPGGPTVLGDTLEVLFALVFLGGIGSLPFARTIFGDIATVVPPLSVLLMLGGLTGMIGTVLVRAGYDRLESGDSTGKT